MKREMYFENDYYAQTTIFFATASNLLDYLRFDCTYFNIFHGVQCAICIRFKSTNDDRKTTVYNLFNTCNCSVTMYARSYIIINNNILYIFRLIIFLGRPMGFYRFRRFNINSAGYRFRRAFLFIDSAGYRFRRTFLFIDSAGYQFCRKFVYVDSADCIFFNQ